MKRRILYLLCVLALCLSLLPATSLAAYDWTYVNDGGYIQSADGQIQLNISKDDGAKTITITGDKQIPANCALALPASSQIDGVP